MLILVEQKLSLDDAVRNSFRAFHKPSPAGREIGAPFVRERLDSGRVEQNQIGILATGYAAFA